MDIYFVLFLFFATVAGLSALICVRALLLIRLRKVYRMVRFNNRLIPTATSPFDVPHPTETQLQKIYALTKGIEVSYSDSMDIYDVVEGFKAYDARSVIAMWSAVGIGGFTISFFMAIGFYILTNGSDAGWGFVVFMGFIVGFLVSQMPRHYQRQKKLRNRK